MTTRKKLNEEWLRESKRQRGEVIEEDKKDNNKNKLTGRCKCGESKFRHKIENHCIIRICKICGDEVNVG